MNRNSFPQLIQEDKKESTGFSPGDRGKIFECTNFIFNQQIDLADNTESVHSLPTIYAPLYMYSNSTKVSYPNKEILFSQLLDLFELIFNQNNMPIKLSLSEDIEVLKAVPEDVKDEKGETIKKYANANPFLTAIKKLNPETAFDKYNIIKCEFDKKEEIIGITSPFTLVCPIADITNTNFYRKNPNYFHNARKLKDRNPEFVSYMNEIHEQVLNSDLASKAHSYLSPFRTYLKGQIESVEREKEYQISAVDFKDYEDSPFINLKFWKGKEIETIDLRCFKKNEDVNSKYKIKPTKIFDKSSKMPLVLKTGLTGKYFDEYNFPGDFKIEGSGTNILPVYNYKYVWLNPLADFLEPVLIVLDYEINKEFLRIGKKKDGIKKCFLPLKPKFFDYFEGKDINDLFEIEMQASGREWKVKLNIPIDDNKIKALQFEKIYTMNDRKQTDNIGTIVELKDDNCPYFAFWPSLKCDIQEDYYIVAYNTSDYKLQINCSSALQLNSIYIERERSVSISKFKSKFPEYIEICISNNTDEHHAVISPFTNRVVESFENKGDVYVSIDFGTTNTNIGVHIPRDNEQIWSFDNEALLQYVHDENTIKEEWTKDKVEDFHKLLKTYFLPEKIQFESVQTEIQNKIAQIPFGSLLLELLNETSIERKSAPSQINIPFFVNYGEDRKNQLAFEFKWGKKNEYIKKYLEEILMILKVYLINSGINPANTTLLTAYPMVYSNTDADSINNVWYNMWTSLGFRGHSWIDEGTASKVFYSKKTGDNLTLSEGTSIVLDIGGGTTDFCITVGGDLKIADSLLFGGRDVIGWFDKGTEDPKTTAMNPIVRFLEHRIHSDRLTGTVASAEYSKNLNSQLKFRYLMRSPNYANLNNIVFSDSDFCFSKIIIGYFYLSVFYYMGMLFKSKKELNSVLPSLVCIGGNSSKFLDWFVKADWETSISKSLVCNLFNDFFIAGYGDKKYEENLFQIYKSDQPKNEVVLGLLLDPPQTREFNEIYKNKYCIYGDTYSIRKNRVTYFEEQVRETDSKMDGTKSLKLEKKDIKEISLYGSEKSKFYFFNKKFISSLDDLKIFEDIYNSEKSKTYLKNIKNILLDHTGYTDILRDEIDLYIKDASQEISTSLFILSAKGMLHKIIKSANGIID